MYFEIVDTKSIMFVSEALILYVDMPKGVDFSLQGDPHIYFKNFVNLGVYLMKN